MTGGALFERSEFAPLGLNLEMTIAEYPGESFFAYFFVGTKK